MSSDTREPATMVTCPRCGGSGRVGVNRAPCRECWVSGVITLWRWKQLMAEDRQVSGEASEGSNLGPTD